MRWSLENKILLAVAILILLVLIVVGAAPHGTSLADRFSADARHSLRVPLFTLGKLGVTPIFLVKTLIFLLLLSVVSNRLRKVTYIRLRDDTGMGPERSYLMARVVSMLVYFIGIMAGLEWAGVSLNTLAIVAGTLGIGVGFGLQSLVANWVAGLVLLVEQPVRIGDCIAVGNTSGIVMRIGGRGTWVRTFDNEVIIVPNSNLTTNNVVNWSANDPKIRLSIPVSVAYDSDPQQVRATLLEIAGQHADVLKDPAPEVVIAELGDSTLNFLLRFWRIIADDDNYRIKSDLYYSILQIFAERKIEMPYPQQDVHVRSVDAPIVVSGISKAAAS